MKKRTRSRKRTAMMGRILYPKSGDQGPFAYTELEASIEDYIDKKKRDDGTTPPSPLNMTTRRVLPPGLTHYQRPKVSPSTPPGNWGIDLPCSQPGATGPFLAPPGGWSALEPNTGEILQKGLSSSNPFRYEVSVPVMVAELIEATTLFKVQLGTLASASGSSYLNAKFGWESMIRDIKTLAKIIGAIESRLKEFNSLVKRGGVRRKVAISKRSVSTAFSNRACFSNSYSTWYSDGNIEYSSRVWLSVRWKPRSDKKVEVERLVKAKSQLLLILFGFERNRTVSIWEILPFSWLVDYFVDISSTLKAMENHDLVEPYDICIMRERTVKVETFVRPKSRNDAFYGYSYATPGFVEITTRLREVVTADVTLYLRLLSFGILTPEQALTILALLASRKRGS